MVLLLQLIMDPMVHLQYFQLLHLRVEEVVVVTRLHLVIMVVQEVEEVVIIQQVEQEILHQLIHHKVFLVI